MSSLDATDNTEELLVLRVDCQSTIVHILYHNEFFAKRAGELIGKKVWDIGLEQTICEQCEAYLHSVFIELRKIVFQLYISNKYYQISFLPEWKTEGKVETVLTIVRDVTKEISVKEKLVKSQIELHMAQDIAMLGYFEWDQMNNDIYWSDQQYRNYGYSPKEVEPTLELFRNHVHPEDWGFIQIATSEFYKKSYLEYQFRIIRTDGVLAWLHLRVNVITNEQGDCINVFGITQDITEQKQAEERIYRVEKELAFTNELYSRSTYLNRLLFNDYPVEQVSKALSEFGIEIQVAHCCFVIKMVENLTYNTEMQDDSILPPIVRKQAILIWLAEREWGLVWRCHDNIVILASMADHIIGNKHSQIQLAKDILAGIEKQFPHFYIKIGISGISRIPINFCEIYQKAQRAAVVAEYVEHSSTIHCDDIGLYEVAFQLLKDQNTCAMVQNTIGRLAEYDEARGSNLLVTLECILENVSLKTVAQKLFVHHNTVIWRKNKIEIFLEMPLDNMEVKMLLLLYIKIWNLKKNIL